MKETLDIMFLAMLQANTKNLSPENTSGKSEVGELQEALQKKNPEVGV